MTKKLFLAILPFMLLTACGKENNPETPEDNDKADYVFLAQPAVAGVMSQKESLKMYANVQNDYKAKTNNLEITQASIFVKASSDNTAVSSFLSMIKNDVTELMADPETVLPSSTSSLEAQVVTGKLGGQVALISKLLKNGNSIGLGYKEAKTNKSAIDAFIGTLGLSASNDNIYFEQNASVPAATTLDLQVACPAGAPATAFYKHLGNSKMEVGNADTIVSYLSSNSNKDVVIAPTNAGIAAINKGATYKLAATITFGNFFILSTGNDTDGVMNKGDKVLAFQESGVPGKLFKYLYNDLELDVTFLNDAAAVKNAVLTEQ